MTKNIIVSAKIIDDKIRTISNGLLNYYLK